MIAICASPTPPPDPHGRLIAALREPFRRLRSITLTAVFDKLRRP